jgi:hypothetical protein
MRDKRQTESDEHRSERLEKNARDRMERAAAEDEALDAAVKRSIEQHGA